jgi:lysophospholipase L1-like esterase
MDYQTHHFKRMVVLGESHCAGQCATSEQQQWVNIVAEYITRFQGTPVDLINKGIGANSISPTSPGYANSAKPSALERYETDVIVHKPDLFILSYGLNDMRAGMPVEAFRRDMERIITHVKFACDPIIVLTTVYYMTRYDWYPPFNKGSLEATELYNVCIKQLAYTHQTLLADIWEAEGQADWVIHPDTVHANDLGHFLIANRVFEVLATHCSGIASRITSELESDRINVRRTIAQRTTEQHYN